MDRQACNPYQPISQQVYTLDIGSPNKVPKIAVGRFRCEFSFTDRVNRIAAIIAGLAQQNIAPDNSMEFLYAYMNFDSTQVEFFSNAQCNQAVTFFLTLEGSIGVSPGNYDNIPVYANIVQQMPQYDYNKELMIPSTLGQLNLQFNRYINPHVVYAITMPGYPAYTKQIKQTTDVFNLLPFITRLLIKADTPIYKGIL